MTKPKPFSLAHGKLFLSFLTFSLSSLTMLPSLFLILPRTWVSYLTTLCPCMFVSWTAKKCCHLWCISKIQKHLSAATTKLVISFLLFSCWPSHLYNSYSSTCGKQCSHLIIHRNKSNHTTIVPLHFICSKFLYEVNILYPHLHIQLTLHLHTTSLSPILSWSPQALHSVCHTMYMWSLFFFCFWSTHLEWTATRCSTDVCAYHGVCVHVCMNA